MRWLATPIMNCDYTTKVSSLIDGELPQPEADRIREHIRTCHTCWQGLEDFLHLRRDIKAYEFAPDLITQRQALRKILTADQPTHPYTRLRERLVNAFVAPRFSPALTAALVLMGIGITLIVVSYQGSHGTARISEVVQQTREANVVPHSPDPSRSASPEVAPERSPGIALSNNNNNAVSRSNETDRDPPPPANKPVVNKLVTDKPVTNKTKTPKPVGEPQKVAGNKRTPQELVREAEQNYQAAIAMLARSVNRSQIDPTALARFEETLASIDQAIADTRRAVRANPDDPVVVQYMLSAYAKKIEVLEEMTAERRTP